MLDPSKVERKAIKWCENDSGLFLPETYNLTEKNDVNKKTLREYIKWGISNITVVLLLPSFLGAVWQILELSSINVAYIRFFSITQIPFDGIIVLILLILIIVMGKMILAFVKNDFKNKSKVIEDEELVSKIAKKLRYYTIKIGIGIVLSVGGLIYLTTELFVDLFPRAPIFTILLLGICVAAIGLMIVDAAILIIVKIRNDDLRTDYTNRYIETFLNKYKNYIYWSFLLGLAFTALILYQLLKSFSASFILPINLYNTKNLESVIYSDFKTKDYSIEYFNDKYIFVKLCAIKKCDHEVDKEIIIYPTEKVLFKTTYGEVWAGYFTTYKPVNNQGTL